MGEQPIYAGMGSIGASQPGLAQYVLSNKLILTNIQVYLKSRKDQTSEGERIEYSPDSIEWFMNKMSVPLSKTALLSSFNNENELLATEWCMFEMFLIDMLSRVHMYKFSEKQILELSQLYFDYTDLALRRAMGRQITDKDFLRGTTGETRTTLDQRVTEEQKKSGGLFGLFR